MTPWADAVFAIDRDWWKQYGAEVQGLACERLSMRLNRHGAKPAGIGCVEVNEKESELGREGITSFAFRRYGDQP